MSITVPTQDELDAKAKAQADAKIAAATAAATAAHDAEVRQRAAAAASMAAAGEAGAGMLQQIGPRVGAAYNDAAIAQGQVSSGLSQEMRARIAAAQAANQGFTQSQTGMQGSSTVDPTKAAVQQGIHDLMTKGSEDDRAYAEELIKIAQEFPELKDAAYEKLFNEAMTRVKTQHDMEMDEKTMALNERNAARQDRAQDLYEDQFALKKQDYKFDVWIQGQKLKLAKQAQKQSVQKAINEGKQPDAALSAKYGHIVDSNGRAILDGSGQKIKVAKDPGKPKAPPKPPAPGNSGYQKAVKEGRTLRGNPTPTPENASTLGAPGRYLAKPGAKGVFPAKKDKNGRIVYPATTNTPAMAARDGEMNFAQAQAYLADVYGLKPQRARAALIAAGWRPDGKRP